MMVDDEGAPIQSTAPQFGLFIKTIDDSLGEELDEDSGAIVTVNSTDYRIGHVERDGTGWGSIKLQLDV